MKFHILRNNCDIQFISLYDPICNEKLCKGYLPGKVGCSEVSKIGLKPCVDVNKMKLPIRAFNYSLSSAQAKNNLL